MSSYTMTKNQSGDERLPNTVASKSRRDGFFMIGGSRPLESKFQKERSSKLMSTAQSVISKDGAEDHIIRLKGKEI